MDDKESKIPEKCKGCIAKSMDVKALCSLCMGERTLSLNQDVCKECAVLPFCIKSKEEFIIACSFFEPNQFHRNDF